MANLTENAKRYRLTVPAQDVSVQEWMNAQINPSVSIRHLIRNDIKKNGFTDVTCRDVEQGPTLGRPTLAEAERRAKEKKEQSTATQEITKEEETSVAETANEAVVHRETTVAQKGKQEVVQQPTFGSTYAEDDILDSLLG